MVCHNKRFPCQISPPKIRLRFAYHPSVSFIQAYRADPYAAQAYDQQWTIFRPPAYGSTGLASGQLCANSYLGLSFNSKHSHICLFCLLEPHIILREIVAIILSVISCYLASVNSSCYQQPFTQSFWFIISREEHRLTCYICCLTSIPSSKASYKGHLSSHDIGHFPNNQSLPTIQ